MLGLLAAADAQEEEQGNDRNERDALHQERLIEAEHGALQRDLAGQRAKRGLLCLDDPHAAGLQTSGQLPQPADHVRSKVGDVPAH